MASGAVVLQRQIDALRSLSKITTVVAPSVAFAAKREIVAQIARGQGPDGKPWKLTKAGTVPLRGAAEGVTVSAVGSVIVIRVDGHHARHHLGAVKGKIKREIIPNRRIPGPLSRAIRRVVVREFRSTMGAV